MSEALIRTADMRSRVNEKLLKALLTLLALKDEHLLDELCTVFAHAQKTGAEEMSDIPPEVWHRVQAQLELVAGLTQGDSEEKVASDSRRNRAGGLH